jgi:hypothetical protein
LIQNLLFSMERNLLKLLLVTAIIFLPVFTQEVFACQCWGISTPYKEFRDANAVFVGSVVSIADSSGKEIIEDKSTDSVDLEEKLRRDNETRYYRFEVQEWFKGTKNTMVIVSLGRNMCQSGFKVGESILVYASGSGDSLRTNTFCARTRDIKESQDDLHFIRELLENKPEPKIYGSVRLYDKVSAQNSLPNTYLEGIKIILKGKNRQFETVTDKNGLYRFYKIPYGKYTIYPKLANEYKLSWFDLNDVSLQRNEDISSEYPYYMYKGPVAFSRFEITLKED